MYLSAVITESYHLTLLWIVYRLMHQHAKRRRIVCVIVTSASVISTEVAIGKSKYEGTRPELGE